MDKKLSLTVALIIVTLVFTSLLFTIVIINQNDLRSDSASSPVASSNTLEPKEIDHPGQKIFKANCTPCHRMNQKLIGPPLAGVLERRDSLWVVKMIRNSSQLIASGDPTAVELFREYNRTQMTSFTSLSDDDLKNLLEYLKLQSQESPAPMPVVLPVNG